MPCTLKLVIYSLVCFLPHLHTSCIALQYEACFYECEPILGHFQPPGADAVDFVPVCASYCDSWFEACRNDTTCTDDWWELLLQADGGGSNNCSNSSECRTFEVVFGNGRELCNRIWSTGYFYSEQEDNCTVFNFEAGMPNPNNKLSFPVRDSAGKTRSSVFIVGMLAMVLLSSV